MSAPDVGADGSGIEDGRTAKRRRTEAKLLDAALDQLERNGLLAGLNLQAVADDAGVNRGLIHHYFGSRQELLRAALLRAQASGRREFQPSLWSRGPRQRGSWLWEHYSSDYARMLLLLVLDGSEDVDVLPELETEYASVAQEKDAGKWVEDLDVEAMLAFYNTFLVGYFTLRPHLARRLGIDDAKLDRRMLRMMDQLFSAVIIDESDNRLSRGIVEGTVGSQHANGGRAPRRRRWGRPGQAGTP